jgi:hypothetical protein
MFFLWVPDLINIWSTVLELDRQKKTVMRQLKYIVVHARKL